MPLMARNRNRYHPDDIWTKDYWNMKMVYKATKNMVPLQNFSKNFIYTTMIGMGSFGKVLLFTSRTDESIQLAVKWYLAHESERPPKNWMMALREIRVLKTSKCPNIVAYKYAFFNTLTHHMFLFMEYCDGGSMKAMVFYRELRSQLTPEIQAYVIKCVANALAFIHAMDVLHRDLKASNVLLTTAGNVKVADFDMCCRMDSPDLENRVGTTAIMSPEMIGIPGVPRCIETKTDIWSLGILMRQMLAGYYVYPSKSKRKIMQIMLNVPRTFPDVQPDSLRTLIRGCLELRADKRPSAEEILQSEFFESSASPEDFKGLVFQSMERSNLLTDFFDPVDEDDHKDDKRYEVRNAEGDMKVGENAEGVNKDEKSKNSKQEEEEEEEEEEQKCPLKDKEQSN